VSVAGEQVLRELFDKIIERDRVYGSLLAKVKTEYDAQRESQGAADSDTCVARMSCPVVGLLTRGCSVNELYSELLLDHARAKADALAAAEDAAQLRARLERLENEVDDARERAGIVSVFVATGRV
jgi:hypothetical protein